MSNKLEIFLQQLKLLLVASPTTIQLINRNVNTMHELFENQ